MELKRQNHEFPPVYDENSEILILGSFPSVKSREMQFFYGHPQNRFWKVMAQVLHENVPQTIPEKKEMLLRHHIALWDVIASCDIAGSSDSSIRNVVPNDLGYIISRSRITKIYANGAKSKQLYDKYLSKQLGIEAVQLPSTSPANAAYSVERLLEYWKNVILLLAKRKVMKAEFENLVFSANKSPSKKKFLKFRLYTLCVLKIHICCH